MSRRVAIIGASTDRRKFGNKALRAFRHQGYTVYPINPYAAEVEGVPAFRSVLDVPGDIDMASMYVPPAVGARVLGEIAAKGIREVWFNPGSGSDSLRAEAQRLGLEPIEACSITGIGEMPGEY